MSFKKAIEFVFKWEGGYVNDPDDPGGETKFGISKRAYPHLDIKNLTEEQAAEIYRRDYWNKVRGDALKEPLDIVMLDTAVNCGIGRAVRWLQEAVGAAPDGIIGPKTLHAVSESLPGPTAVRVLAQRLKHYAELAKKRSLRKFLRGWVMRVADLMEYMSG